MSRPTRYNETRLHIKVENKNKQIKVKDAPQLFLFQPQSILGRYVRRIFLM